MRFFPLVCAICWAGVAAAQTNIVKYELGPDSLPQEGVPKGKLEGPLLFRSEVF